MASGAPVFACFHNLIPALSLMSFRYLFASYSARLATGRQAAFRIFIAIRFCQRLFEAVNGNSILNDRAALHNISAALASHKFCLLL